MGAKSLDSRENNNPYHASINLTPAAVIPGRILALASSNGRRVVMQNGEDEQPQLVPPLNFSCVELGVYRSGQPLRVNFRFLTSLHLKTIVWLSSEEPSAALVAFAEASDITIHKCGVPTTPSTSTNTAAATAGNNSNTNNGAVASAINSTTYEPLTDKVVAGALAHLVDRSEHPVLVTSEMGRYRTGVVISCLRRLQGWNLRSTLAEYRRFVGVQLQQSEIATINEALIEGFDLRSVQIPTDPALRPMWLYAFLLTHTSFPSFLSSSIS